MSTQDTRCTATQASDTHYDYRCYLPGDHKGPHRMAAQPRGLSGQQQTERRVTQLLVEHERRVRAFGYKAEGEE